MQIRVWRSNASDLSWSTESDVFGNLLLLAFAKQNSLDDRHANSSILCNCDNTCFLDILFSRNHLCSTSLENLLYKKVTINKININKLFIKISIHTAYLLDVHRTSRSEVRRPDQRFPDDVWQTSNFFTSSSFYYYYCLN